MTEISTMSNGPINRQEAFEFAAQEHKAALAEYAADSQRSLESVRAANISGAEALKAATLINGGAAVAILAFIGHLASINAKPPVVMDFAKPLRSFVVGALLGVVASGVTYLAHMFYIGSLTREFQSKEARREDNETLAVSKHKASVRWGRIGRVVNLVVMALVAASLFSFAYGCYIAYRAFESGITSPTRLSAQSNLEMYKDFGRLYNDLL